MYKPCKACVGLRAEGAYASAAGCSWCKGTGLRRDPASYSCNKCGGPMCPPNSGPDGEDCPCGLVEHTVSGGYSSPALSDCTNYKFSMCEVCLRELFNSFKVPPVLGDYMDGADAWAYDDDRESYELAQWVRSGGQRDKLVSGVCNATERCTNPAEWRKISHDSMTDQSVCESHAVIHPSNGAFVRAVFLAGISLLPEYRTASQSLHLADAIVRARVPDWTKATWFRFVSNDLLQPSGLEEPHEGVGALFVPTLTMPLVGFWKSAWLNLQNSLHRQDELDGLKRVDLAIYHCAIHARTSATASTISTTASAAARSSSDGDWPAVTRPSTRSTRSSASASTGRMASDRHESSCQTWLHWPGAAHRVACMAMRLRWRAHVAHLRDRVDLDPPKPRSGRVRRVGRPATFLGLALQGLRSVEGERMNLSNEQLGRIARTCKNGFDMWVLEHVLDDQWERAVQLAAAGEPSETPTMRVLREVAEEVAEAKERRERQCIISAWSGVFRLGTSQADGLRILDDVACRMRSTPAVDRITITNAAYGVEWTWEAR